MQESLKVFSVSFTKFVRTGFKRKTAGTFEIHKDFQSATEKIPLKMRFTKFSGRPCLFVRKH